MKALCLALLLSLVSLPAMASLSGRLLFSIEERSALDEAANRPAEARRWRGSIGHGRRTHYLIDEAVERQRPPWARQPGDSEARPALPAGSLQHHGKTR